ncbi:hypothetical protein LSAT2_021419 [Lamellibrachia satsuma]|nr:hypothetical protein LSAT2_021419 [Lamellibrachia satsuma]
MRGSKLFFYAWSIVDRAIDLLTIEVVGPVVLYRAFCAPSWQAASPSSWLFLAALLNILVARLEDAARRHCAIQRRRASHHLINDVIKATCVWLAYVLVWLPLSRVVHATVGRYYCLLTIAVGTQCMPVVTQLIAVVAFVASLYHARMVGDYTSWCDYPSTLNCRESDDSRLIYDPRKLTFYMPVPAAIVTKLAIKSNYV